MFRDLGDVIRGEPIRFGNHPAIDRFVVRSAHSLESAGEDADRPEAAAFGILRAGLTCGHRNREAKEQLGARGA